MDPAALTVLNLLFPMRRPFWLNLADARDSGITAVSLTVGEVGNGLSFFGCGHRSPRLEELCRMLSAREA